MVENMAKAPNNFPLSRAETNNYRFERKFVFDNLDLEEIINSHVLNNSYFFKEVYERRTVNNIYFDDWSHSFYKMNVSGVGIRSKYRLRWYGDFKKRNIGNLELKFKRNIYGWKKIYKIKDLILENQLNHKIIKDSISKNLPLNARIFFDRNNKSQIVNQYKREYFISYDKRYRITIDKNMKIFNQRNKSELNLKKKEIIQNYFILEVKFDRSCYNKIDTLLHNIPIRASRNSKYVNSIRAALGI